ncbi:MAG: AAA family ATPase [Clostridia bacterium]|nr:AAA family ATPase [Clostridia bacterium]
MMTDKTADLDSLVGYFTPNLKKQRALLNSFLHPLSCKEEIDKRRQIISSFEEQSALLSEYASWIEDAGRARNDYETAKKRSGIEPLTRIEDLCVSALALFGAVKRASGLPLHKDLRKRLSEISRQTDAVSSHLLSFIDNDPPALCFRISDYGRIEYASFDISDYSLKDKDPQKKGRSFFFPRKTDAPVRVVNVSELTASACDNLERSLDSLVYGIGNEIKHLLRDLDFYSAALDYYAFLKEHKIPYCFSEYDGSVEFSGLYDLLLVAKKGTVVPNDFKLNGKHGALITGPNGSGKTVLWRSVLTAALLNQSGLPVPAISAKLPVFTGINSIMSCSISRDGFGAFEEEVRDLSDIMNTVSGGSAVFLNEIFQTTSYEEGAKALTSILNSLSKRGVVCVAVTHLPVNASMLDYERIEMNVRYS